METVSNEPRLSARVLSGLKLINKTRFQNMPVWGEGLTILDEETAKPPLVKRKALAVKKVLSEMPVSINHYELLVGRPFQLSREASRPLPEYATAEEKEVAAKNLTGTGALFGHFSPYYPRYLQLGLDGLRKMAGEKLDKVRQEGKEPAKEAWYESVIISLDGLKNLVQRYADLALRLAQGESDNARKGELQEISTICRHLLQGPPQTFHEALQASWFAHIAFSSTLDFVPLGRFDQNLWPFLKRDLEKGTITMNKAQELINCLWLKFNELLQASAAPPPAHTSTSRLDYIGASSLFMGGKTSTDRMVRDKTSAELSQKGTEHALFLQTITLSGLTPEGLDGTNPLTYLCLNATRILGLPQPSLYVRFHDGSPPELYERVADCLRAECVGPTIYNDEVIIPSLKKLGIPIERARDYTSDGCWETYVQGRTEFKYGFVSAAEALDRALSPARWEEEAPGLYIEALDPYRDYKAPDPYGFHSFAEVMDSVKVQLDKYVKGFIEAVESLRDGRAYYIAPDPLLSAFVIGPLESGKDIQLGGMEYRFHALILAGLSHAVDSLAAIKKLCFEEKAIDWPELLDALRSNWQGKEYLRQMVRTRAPAYGNDVDYVDDIAREIVEYFVQSIKKHSAKVKTNIKFCAGVGTFQINLSLGRPVGATPDGRFAGEPLSSNASPSAGRAVSGQTAAVNSLVKLPLIDLPIGSPLDLAICSREDLLLQLEAFIKSFIEKRGNMVNIAVNDCEKLRAAQKEPEKYRDLKVRVGGFEAYFVDLPPHYQQFQIEKCQQYA